jgi:hypothetical protein
LHTIDLENSRWREYLLTGKERSRMRSAPKTVLYTWLLAGTLDITAASVYYTLTYGISLAQLYQNIASGVFGDSAFEGGTPMACLGLALHYAIAFVWTLFFFVAFPRIKLLRMNAFASSAAFGIFIWLVMNLVVLPLSRVSPSPIRLVPALIGAAFLVFCIALPNVLIIGKFYAHQPDHPA